MGMGRTDSILKSTRTARAKAKVVGLVAMVAEDWAVACVVNQSMPASAELPVYIRAARWAIVSASGFDLAASANRVTLAEGRSDARMLGTVVSAA